MVYEDECERDGRSRPSGSREIRAAVLEAGLNAINMPEEWGGAGLSVLEQVVVQEELGKLTGALWDCVWRPAEPAARLHAGAARALARARASAASGATRSPSPRRTPARTRARSPRPRRRDGDG